MRYSFYDLIVVGRGTAAAAFINTLDLDQMFPWFRERRPGRVPKILIVGEDDPWQGLRGKRPEEPDAPNNKLNQPWHMISQYSNVVPTFKVGGWEAMVTRDEYAAVNAKILEQYKYAKCKNAKVILVDELVHQLRDRTVYGYVVKVEDKENDNNNRVKEYATQRIVLASGAGPHRVPAFLKLPQEQYREIILDMDRFGRGIVQLKETYRNLMARRSIPVVDPSAPAPASSATPGLPGQPRKLKVLIFGPNAVLDSVEVAGYDDLDITWFVPGDPAILATKHQTVAARLKAENKLIKFSESDARVTVDPGKGTDRIKCIVGGKTYIGDVLVYGLGQDDKKATDYISDAVKKELLPLFDNNQKFGETHESVLGFYGMNKVTTNKLIVVGALAQQVATNMPADKSKQAYIRQMGEIIKREQDLCIYENISSALGMFQKKPELSCLLNTPEYYGKLSTKDPAAEEIRSVQRWLESGEAKPFIDDTTRLLRSLSVTILNLITGCTFFDTMNQKAIDSVTNKSRKDAKFWQELLNNPTNRLTASTVGSPQLASVIATTAAINGYMPTYVKHDNVNFNQDDQTVLRTFIAANYWRVDEGTAANLIRSILVKRKTGNENWGIDENDAREFKSQLAFMHDINRTRIDM